MLAFPAIAAPKASARYSRERERPRTIISPMVENAQRPSAPAPSRARTASTRPVSPGSRVEHHPRHVSGDDMPEFMGKERIELAL